MAYILNNVYMIYDKVIYILYHLYMINPLPDDKFLDWSKLKQIADDIL